MKGNKPTRKRVSFAWRIFYEALQSSMNNYRSWYYMSMRIFNFLRIGSKLGALRSGVVSPPEILSEISSSLSRLTSLAIFRRNWATYCWVSNFMISDPPFHLTGLENHLPPPVSNQLRCPPKEVVQSTANLLHLNSWKGIASFTAICAVLVNGSRSLHCWNHTGSSSAFTAKSGVLTAKSESLEEASR